MAPNSNVGYGKLKLPETLPEFPVVDTPSEFSVLAALDALEEATSREEASPGDGSGVQAVGQAWKDVHSQMRHAFSENDYERALMLGERYLKHDDADTLARLYVEECRLMLEVQLVELLQPLDRIVKVRLRIDDPSKARIDPRGAFLLSRIDGASTVDDLLDIAGMPRVDALRYLVEWVQQGHIALDH